MPGRDVILSWIEESEYQKERARRIGEQVAGQLDIDRLERDQDGYLAFLIALLLSRLELEVLADIELAAATFARRLGFEAITDQGIASEITAALRATEEDLIQDTEAWAQDLDERLREIEDSGVRPEIIASVTDKDSPVMAAAAAALAVMFAAAAAVAVNTVASLVLDDFSFRSTTQNELRRWITVSSGKSPSCRGQFETACAPRHGAVRTLSEWAELGEPNAPTLNCVVWNDAEVCRCILAPVGFKTESPISASEAIERGRDRGKS